MQKLLIFQAILFTIIFITSSKLFYSQNLSQQQQFDDDDDNTTTQIYQKFIEWQEKHQKFYDLAQIQAYRFSIFTENYYFIRKQNLSYIGLNIMADLTNEEYNNMYISDNLENIKEREVLLQLQQQEDEQERNQQFQDIPEVDINWIQKGGVTQIQDMGQCAASAFFATIAAAETLYYTESDQLLKFSEQQPIDCYESQLFRGCSPITYAVDALYYSSKYGTETAQAYPFVSGVTGKPQKCQYNTEEVIFHYQGYWHTSQYSDYNTQTAVQKLQNSAIMAKLDASSILFQLYNGGIMNSEDCGDYNQNLNVAIVGVNTISSEPYWIVKNAWGTSWGENGYMKLAFSPSGPGICSVNWSFKQPYIVH